MKLESSIRQHPDESLVMIFLQKQENIEVEKYIITIKNILSSLGNVR